MLIRRIYFFYFLLTFYYYGYTQSIITKEVELKDGKISIFGIVSFQERSKRQPLLIYVPGSGNIDRNGNQKGEVYTNYIQQLTDSLNKHGIAVFRYDKRTANTKNFPFLNENIRFEDFVSDVKTIVSYFNKDKKFSEIILLGHSQGGLVATLVAQQTNINKLICIASPSKKLEEVLDYQLEKQNPSLASKAREYFKELQETDTIKNVHLFLISLFSPGNQKFIKSWNQYDPIKEIKKLTIPILIVNGSSDLQVSVENAEKLHHACGNSVLKVIQKMTHTLKTIENSSENLLTYSTLVIQFLRNW